MSEVSTKLGKLIIEGDLSKLTAEEKVVYYSTLCDSLGLNALTRPFDYITLNGKLTLYARKDATDQLRSLKGISVTKLERTIEDGLCIVTVYVQTSDGRMDVGIGAVNIDNLKGDARANAIMKAETKSKRRATLSICGLGILDESEVETIRDVTQKVDQPKKIEDTPAVFKVDNLEFNAEELTLYIVQLIDRVNTKEERNKYIEWRDQNAEELQRFISGFSQKAGVVIEAQENMQKRIRTLAAETVDDS